jgi:hypothetical protein
VYARRDADDEPRRLVGFSRLEVAAGAAHQVEIAVPLTRLERRDVSAHRMKLFPGTYLLQVARHAADHAADVAVQIPWAD